MPAISISHLQPFKAVRDNWTTLKPYYENYITAINFVNVLAAFLNTSGLMIKNGFKMLRLHADMDLEELAPTTGQHPNEYISVNDLTEIKLFEFELVENRSQKAETTEMGDFETNENQIEIEVEKPAGNYTIKYTGAIKNV